MLKSLPLFNAKKVLKNKRIPPTTASYWREIYAERLCWPKILWSHKLFMVNVCACIHLSDIGKWWMLHAEVLRARPLFSHMMKQWSVIRSFAVQLHLTMLMVFQPRWPHLQAKLLPLQMNPNPRWKSGNPNSRARSHLGPLIISYVHITAGMHACTGAHKRSTGCHRHLAWIFECQSCSIGGGSSRDSVSIWGGCRGENEFVPLWEDWHILLFLFHTSPAYIVCMSRRRQL